MAVLETLLVQNGIGAAMPDPHRLITQLDLSVHTYYRLFKADLFTVAKIRERPTAELLEILHGRRHLDELRAALIAAGYDDPWPELDAPQPDASPSIHTLRLRPDIAEVLAWAEIDTLAKVLATPPDDLLDYLNWNQFDSLRRRLIQLGHMEPGNVDRQ